MVILNDIIRKLKHALNCNVYLVDDGSIELFGDQRDKVRQYLIDNHLSTKNNIIIHGF